jgi:hypothetical protein
MFMKSHHLDKIARLAWMVKNIASPWYWGYRAAYAGGKEMLARFFLARMATIVGVEAIRLYSGRAPGAEKWRKYDLAVQEIWYLTAVHAIPEAEAQRFLLGLILKSRELPEPAKLTLIDRIARCPADQPAEFGSLSAAERGQVRRWLKKFIVTLMPPALHKPQLHDLRQRLAEPAAGLE